MQIQQVIETCLYAEDLDTAKQFYQNVLGLNMFVEVEGRHAFFTHGTGVVLLFNPETTNDPNSPVPPHGAKGAGHIAFQIAEDEYDDWLEWLQSKGVDIEQEHVWPNDRRSIYFRDPADNSLELVTPGLWDFARE